MSEICRMCLSSYEDMISIFFTEGDSIAISEMISICTGIEISKYDNLSERICQNCLTVVTKFFLFREQCWKSSKYLLNEQLLNIRIEQRSPSANRFDDMDTYNISDNPQTNSLGSKSDADSTTSDDTVANSELTTKNQNYSLKKRRSCYICDEQFVNIFQLRKHLSSIHSTPLDEEKLENTCPVCDKKFNTFVSFSKHFSTHNPKFKCDVCNIKFHTQNELISHNLHDHDNKDEVLNLMDYNDSVSSDSPKKNRSCYLCDQIFENINYLKIHLTNKHSTELDESKLVHKCNECYKIFQSFGALKKHVSIDHSHQYTCKYCYMKLDNSKQFTDHIQSKHKNLIRSNENDSSFSEMDNEIELIKNRRCYMCDHCFFNLKDLKIHFLKTHGDDFDETKLNNICEFCYKDFGRFHNLQAHIRTIHSHKNICTYCGIMQKSTVKLVQHIHNIHLDVDFEKSIGYDRQNYHQTKIFISSKEGEQVNSTSNDKLKRRKCYLCDERFESADAVREHVTTVHNKLFERKRIVNECEICKKVFGTYKLLVKHIIRYHPRSYICDQCGKSWPSKRGLLEHIRRHTGEKPYKCNECDYRAVDPFSIKGHKRTHTGEIPFECHICHKKYRSTSARARHIRTHSDERPYVCIVCRKSFKQLKIYKDHLLIHDLEKHIACEYCGKKFSGKRNLAPHLKTHTGERTHHCDLCGKGFIQRHSWRTHMKNVHSEIVV